MGDADNPGRAVAAGGSLGTGWPGRAAAACRERLGGAGSGVRGAAGRGGRRRDAAR